MSVVDSVITAAPGGAIQWMSRLLGLAETDRLTSPAPGWTSEYGSDKSHHGGARHAFGASVCAVPHRSGARRRGVAVCARRAQGVGLLWRPRGGGPRPRTLAVARRAPAPMAPHGAFNPCPPDWH